MTLIILCTDAQMFLLPLKLKKIENGCIKCQLLDLFVHQNHEPLLYSEQTSSLVWQSSSGTARHSLSGQNPLLSANLSPAVRTTSPSVPHLFCWKAKPLNTSVTTFCSCNSQRNWKWTGLTSAVQRKWQN